MGSQSRGRTASRRNAPRPWGDSLRSALARYSDPQNGIESGQVLDTIANRVIGLALGGDFEAIKEIANRLDGKPAQAIEHAFDTGELTHDEWIRKLEELRKADAETK